MKFLIWAAAAASSLLLAQSANSTILAQGVFDEYGHGAYDHQESTDARGGPSDGELALITSAPILSGHLAVEKFGEMGIDDEVPGALNEVEFIFPENHTTTGDSNYIEYAHGFGFIYSLPEAYFFQRLSLYSDGDLYPITAYLTYNGRETSMSADVDPRYAGVSWFLTDGYDLTGTGIPEQTGTAVPEPATWSLMILGFGLIGGAMRRRRPALAR